jgi:16S rRNA (cytosine967-C5)-methyltransferase
MVSAPRQIAVRLLRDAELPGDFLEHRLERDRFVQELRPEDRRLVQELLFGVVRWRATLDWMIHQRTEGRPQLPLTMTLLRLAFYQLFWLDRVPAYAVLNDSVEMARRTGGEGLGKFINAVLRGATRDREAIGQAFDALQQSDPATAWSHPAWLVKRWQELFGAAATRRLLEWDNTPPETYVRLNPRRLSMEKLIELWRDERVEYDFKGYDWTTENLVCQLGAHPPLARLRSFVRGGYYVQDPSTLLAVRELAPKAGETILDYCAAPGGKSTFIAQLMEDKGIITAHDPSIERLRLVRENASRLGLSSVFPTNVAPSPMRERGRYDRVLVDAPCSNTGVLRRRLEARWRLREEEIPRLAAQQLRTLLEVADLLKAGGRLVYSTCSLEPEENRAVVDRFIAQRPNFSFVRDRQLSPLKEKVDGAYVAVLQKN